MENNVSELKWDLDADRAEYFKAKEKEEENPTHQIAKALAEFFVELSELNDGSKDET